MSCYGIDDETDVRWSKDAPKAPGWYWTRHDGEIHPMWPVKKDEELYGGTLEFGPPIPSPEVLARAVEFLREVHTFATEPYRQRAAVLLSDLAPGAEQST